MDEGHLCSHRRISKVLGTTAVGRQAMRSITRENLVMQWSYKSVVSSEFSRRLDF